MIRIHDTELRPNAPLIVALAHPSMEHAVAVFADQMRNEQRYFSSPTPKMTLSSLRELVSSGGLRLGVVVNGELVGMARVEDDGRAVIAVLEQWRGRGFGRQLLEATLRRAPSHGHERVVVRCSRRSRALVNLGNAVGATVVDFGSGRIDLLFNMERFTHTA